jgi:hypothetical protein
MRLFNLFSLRLWLLRCFLAHDLRDTSPEPFCSPPTAPPCSHYSLPRFLASRHTASRESVEAVSIWPRSDL